MWQLYCRGCGVPLRVVAESDKDKWCYCKACCELPLDVLFDKMAAFTSVYRPGERHTPQPVKPA